MRTLSYRIGGMSLVSHEGEPDALEVTVSLYECEENGRERDGWSVVVTCYEAHVHGPTCARSLMEPAGQFPGARAQLLAERAAARRAATRRVRHLPVEDRDREIERTQANGGGP